MNANKQDAGVPMWPTDPWEALRRIEEMGGSAGYIARECIRRNGEQCRAASGDSVVTLSVIQAACDEYARVGMEQAGESEYFADAMEAAIKAALRALSRGVPEGETVPKILMRAVKAANSAGAESLADDILNLMDTHWPTSDTAIAAQRKEVE